MSRYPYTYAADYIRNALPFDVNGCKLSRADVSQIRQAIAKAIGMDDELLAQSLAYAYMKENSDDQD